MIAAPSPSHDPTLAFASDWLVDHLLTSLSAHTSCPPEPRHPLPWTLGRRDAAMELRLTRPHAERLADPANRELIMACGAVVENVRIAANQMGRAVRVERFPAGDHATVARLSIDACVAPRREEEALYAFIARPPRGAWRTGGHTVSPALLAVLRHAARSGGGRLDVIDDDGRRALLGALEFEAVSGAGAERVAGLETDEPTFSKRIGMQGRNKRDAPCLDELLSMLGGHVIAQDAWRSTGGCTARASRVRAPALEAPLIGVLGTAGDTPSDWLSAGSAMQRVLLHATAQGLGAAFLNEPVHDLRVRDALRSMSFSSGAPQAILRFDFGDDAPQSTGRNVVTRR